MKKCKNLLTLAIVLLMAPACDSDCPQIWGGNGTNYSYKPDTITPAGYRIDTKGEEVDLAALDCIITATQLCFWSKTAVEMGEYSFDSVDQECAKIIISPDWFYIDENEKSQKFPCDIGRSGNLCSGIIQNYEFMVVTPNLKALAHEITHVHTKASDPFPPSFEPCANGIRAHNCQKFIEKYKNLQVLENEKTSYHLEGIYAPRKTSDSPT